MEVHPETLRRWMLAEGLRSRMRTRKAHRKRREPREHFGELVQMAGSFHEWYEQHGPKGFPMNLLDDATATTPAVTGDVKTIWTAARVLRGWIERYGVPVALYTDWKTVYVKEASERQLLRGEASKSQFGGMCERFAMPDHARPHMGRFIVGPMAATRRFTGQGWPPARSSYSAPLPGCGPECRVRRAPGCHGGPYPANTWPASRISTL